MRTIKKSLGDRNHNLERAEQINGIPSSKEEAERAWDNFSDVNNTLALKLLRQQFGLCCYTELNLADMKREQGLGAHFEHEQPKSQYPARTFDEKNILRSILNSNDLKQYAKKQQFGGHHKGSDYDPAFFISPQQKESADIFVYLPDGTVQPKFDDGDEHQKAEKMIKLLNLNAPFLIAERQRWLDEIRTEIDRMIDNDDIESLKIFAEHELCLTGREHPDLPGNDFGQLNRFHSAVRSLFGAVGNHVIAANCSQID